MYGKNKNTCQENNYTWKAHFVHVNSTNTYKIGIHHIPCANIEPNTSKA